MGMMRAEFWKQHPGLVWSNPDALDSVYIRAALLRPRFGRLLDIAVEFGIDRLRDEWFELCSEEAEDLNRVRGAVERILDNIGKGFDLAAA